LAVLAAAGTPAAYAQTQLFQILFSARQWRIPENRFVYISHMVQPTLSNSLGPTYVSPNQDIAPV